MKSFFYFVYRFRITIVFILLESVNLELIYIYRNGNAMVLNTNSYISGKLNDFFDNICAHKSDKVIHTELLNENISLRKEIFRLQKSPNIQLITLPDVNKIKYDIILAKVVNNSINNARNYITINKGSLDGVDIGMGVICSNGIVGKIKAVSKHFSTVMSLLHLDILISAKIKESDVLGTVRWQNFDIYSAKLLYIPMHAVINKGDNIITSGYSDTFYEGIPIGVVKNVSLEKNAPFYDIDITISTDFSKLTYVYIIKNIDMEEKNQLEKNTKKFYGEF